MSCAYRNVLIPLSLSLVLFLHGCAFLTLEKELTALEQVHVLTGSIVNRTRPDSHVVILLYAKTKNGLRVSQASLHTSELSQFVVEAPNGIFYLLAFEDIDQSLSRDGNEALGFYGDPSPIHISDRTPTTLGGFDIHLNAANELPADFPDGISISPDTLRGTLLKMGQIVGFDDPVFSPEFGSKGYWEPLTFLREVGLCLFFTENYDARKTPVLFVHGASGTPLGWQNLVSHLDPDRFQPWFYYYPSGLPLGKVSRALNQMVKALHRYYDFKELFVVAHSMGGLVAKAFILQNHHESQQIPIRLFVSISTPWNGHRMSAQGVRQAPTPVPSWHDMVPNSAFIKSLFEGGPPEDLRYHLFFSYKGDCSLFLANNDGTVELSSELDARAQKEAERLYGYNEDHGSILNSDAVLTQISRLLSLSQKPPP